MKFEDIFALWEQDSQIDRANLGNESISVPSLHHKYYKILVGEKAALRALEAEYKVLKVAKYEFYSQGPDEESRAKGWKLPPRGILLKADVPAYIEADPDIIALSLKIGLFQEKVDFLESIIKTFSTRGYLIRCAVDYQKFQLGG